MHGVWLRFLCLFTVSGTLLTLVYTVLWGEIREAVHSRDFSWSQGAPTKSRGNILIVLPKDHYTGGDYGFRQGGWLEKAIENRQAYADRHGYKFVWEDLDLYGREYDDPCWAKIAALQHAFDANPDVEWIWMLDGDAIILNQDIDLWDHLLSDEALKRVIKANYTIEMPGDAVIEAHKTPVFTPSEVIPEEVHFVIATDNSGLNAGSFFVRRTPFMSAMIDFWHDPYLIKAKFIYKEQDALGHLMMTHPHFLKHVGIVDQKLINQYMYELEEGDFVLHFAGCWANEEWNCDELFKEHWNKSKKPLYEPKHVSQAG